MKFSDCPVSLEVCPMQRMTIEGYEFKQSVSSPNYCSAIAPHNSRIRISLLGSDEFLWRIHALVGGEWLEADVAEEYLPSAGQAALEAIERVAGIDGYLERQAANAIESAKWWQRRHDQLNAIRNAIKNP